MEGGRTNETRETVNAMRKVYARSNDEMVERQELNLSERPHLLIDRLKKKAKTKNRKKNPMPNNNINVVLGSAWLAFDAAF